MPDYTLEELSVEDADNLTRELQQVLEKYGAEMGVVSNINLMKRVPVEGVLSPLTMEDIENGGGTESETTDTETETGS